MILMSLFAGQQEKALPMVRCPLRDSGYREPVYSPLGRHRRRLRPSGSGYHHAVRLFCGLPPQRKHGAGAALSVSVHRPGRLGRCRPAVRSAASAVRPGAGSIPAGASCSGSPGKCPARRDRARHPGSLPARVRAVLPT